MGRDLAAEKLRFQKAHDVIRTRLALRDLAVRGQVVDDVREDLGEQAGGLLLGNARLRGELIDAVLAEDLRELVGSDAGVGAGADPALHEVAEAFALEELRESADAADAGGVKQIGHALERVLMLRRIVQGLAAALREAADDLVEDAHGFTPLKVPMTVHFGGKRPASATAEPRSIDFVSA